jgi:hypothetical protein
MYKGCASDIKYSKQFREGFVDPNEKRIVPIISELDETEVKRQPMGCRRDPRERRKLT